MLLQDILYIFILFFLQFKIFYFLNIYQNNISYNQFEYQRVKRAYLI